MARSFTAAQLRTRAQQRADMVNSTFISDDEWLGMLNGSYTWLYDLLVKSGEHYFESTTNITSTGVAAYNLPSDFYAMLAVDYQSSSTIYIPLRRMSIQERNAYNGQSGSQSLGYRLTGATITLYPTPATGQVYRLMYVPACGTLDDAADTVDGVSGWEELIVLDAAIKARAKEESDTSHLERERQRMIDRIEENKERELMTPRTIQDVSEPIIDDPADWWTT